MRTVREPASEAVPPRVALVAYFFPPLGGVAVARMVGFARHLPASGWTPVVIAPSGSPYILRDEAALASLPASLEVHRALSPEPAHLTSVARRLRSAARRLRSIGARGAGQEPAAAATLPAEPARASASWLAPWPGRLRRFAWFPDDQAGWLPFAVAAIVAAHRRAPLAAIVSSASPLTAHVAALIGSRLVGVPWIADFRDPWLDNPVEPPQGRFARWRRATLEAVLVGGASRCTFASPSLTATYRCRYPRRAARMSTVFNGYEPAGAIAPPAARSVAEPGTPRPFHLVYAGSLYRPAELDVFLEGVRRALDRRPDLARRLRIRFVGTVTDECRAVADSYLADPRMASVVELAGFVPRAEAQAAVAAADAALALLGPGPGMEVFIGAKLFDYLAQDRQVLAVVPEGDTRAILADLGWGVVADPEPEAVATALAVLVDAPPPSGRADPGGRYLRSSTTRRLGRLLDEVGRRADHGA